MYLIIIVKYNINDLKIYFSIIYIYSRSHVLETEIIDTITLLKENVEGWTNRIVEH
jgi:hypothetical protein